jgi:hypothetical protein
LADVDGDLKPDLVGLGKSETGTSLQFWKEKSGEFERYVVEDFRFKGKLDIS